MFEKHNIWSALGLQLIPIAESVIVPKENILFPEERDFRANVDDVNLTMNRRRAKKTVRISCDKMRLRKDVRREN